MTHFFEIDHGEIASNPRNPRGKIGGSKFKELVASIRRKGVIEPIIVRPHPDNSSGFHYEVVAGERRFKAVCEIARKDSIDPYRIPAIIEKLTDDEAFDYMVIENLQREDLTDLEEAESFKDYLGEKGDEAILELAARIGFRPDYIRRRMAVLSLPKYVLKAWAKGKLGYGHLEQLMRLGDDAEIKKAYEWTLNVGRFDEGEAESVEKVKEYIDGKAPPLYWARFKLEEAGCAFCEHNSDVQRALWDMGGMDKAHCFNSKCFKKNLGEYFEKKWSETAFSKKFGTNGFKFTDDIEHGDYVWMLNGALKECRECADFLTVLKLDGNSEDDFACFGNRECYDKLLNAAQKKEPVKGKEVTAGPRVAWHGEHFRERFLKGRIPERFEDYRPGDERIIRLALFSFLKQNNEAKLLFAKNAEMVGDDASYWDVSEAGKKGYFAKLEGMTMGELMITLKKTALDVIMQKDFGARSRRRVADHLEIDLSKEWAITEEYLQKKTMREILMFGKKLKLFSDAKVKKYLVEVIKKSEPKKCKKSELLDLILLSGVELVGKVPGEILLKDK